MSSHKPSAGRIPRLKDVASQSQSSSPVSSSPVMTAPGSSAIPALSARLQGASVHAKRANASNRSNRASSAPAADPTTRHGPVPPSGASSRTPSTHNTTTTSYPPSTDDRDLISPSEGCSRQPPRLTGSRNAPRHHQSTDSGPPPPSQGPTKQESAGNKPRNVLRRKAATIGQQTAQTMERAGLGKLNVIIPNSARPGPFTKPLPQASASQTDLDQHKISSSQNHNHHDEIKNKNVTPVTRQAPQAPKELASLRTVVNTQNLPPPTPLFPSASSPSTRYSGSPGMWSRGSTPTSLSSYSPGIVHPMKTSTRLRQPSPSHTRLPIFSPSLLQSAHQRDKSESKRLRSPATIAHGTGSSTSLAQEQTEGTPSSAKSPVPSSASSMLPRTAKRSSLPRVARSGMEPPKSEAKPFSETHRVSKSEPCTSIPRGPAIIPSRPTRDGTDRLEKEDPSPVIRSNLSPGTVTSHKRRDSFESAAPSGRKGSLASNVSAATSADSLHSRSSSRTPTSAEVSRKSPRTALNKDRKTTQKLSSSSPVKTRRFGLFTKRSKPDIDAQGASTARKGPTAGTGHEGYGKYSQRGRKSSTANTSARESTTRPAPKNTAPSRDNRNSVLELDEFLLDRLEPRVISGGGMNGASLSRTQSEQSTSGYSTASSTTTLASAQTPEYADPNTADSHGQTGTMSHRPSVSAPSVPTASGIPKPFSCSNGNASFEARQSTSFKSTRPKNIAPRPSHSKTAEKPPVQQQQQQQQQKKPSKPTLSLKWNPFQKSPDKGRQEEYQVPVSPPEAQVRATVAPAVTRRPVAHYALVDTDSDPLEDVVHGIEDSPPTDAEDDLISPFEDKEEVEVPPALNTQKQSDSILLPSPPQLQRGFSDDVLRSPKVYFTKKAELQSPSHDDLPSPEYVRPSRLASVGRIPRVVSRRDRQHRPDMQSFSRPFSVTESPSLPAPVRDLPYETSPGSSRPDPKSPWSPDLSFDLTQPFGDPAKTSILDFIAGPYSKNEFLTFRPEKDSMSSCSPGSLPAVPAPIPEPQSQLSEDEIWKEYDDLIDHVLSPETASSGVSGLDTDGKFENATMASRTLQAELHGATNKAQSGLDEQPTVAFTPASPQSSNGSVRLRRSRIAPALHSSLVPVSQPSYSDLLASYAGRSDEETPNQSSTTLATVENPGSYSTESLEPSPNSFETCRQRNAILFDIAERDREGPTAQTNIRSGSLMTSRWLSFGRVLFSPAHNHVIKSGDREKILVVDGLGNDDWSFYCSLTYPNADVYYLYDGPPPSTAKQGPKHPAAWTPPENHHTVYHPHLEHQFPFPKGFFTATVLRFPAVCPESVQSRVAGECKRVLKPGGYLEMSVLDLDMVNMGIRTRKAVRALKERTYLSDPSISLKPATDSIQRLLGKHGFDNLRRCMVRIPVAGMIVRSSASSSSTSSSDPSASFTTPSSSTAFSFSLPSTSTTTLPAMHRTTTKSKPYSKSTDTDLSLGDLLSDPSPSPSNDESIRKIVARVGRWWYTRCYEIPVLPNGDAELSIWADRKILRECQRRGTGFRLLIAYAQKPSEKRRTASV